MGEVGTTTLNDHFEFHAAFLVAVLSKDLARVMGSYDTLNSN